MPMKKKREKKNKFNKRIGIGLEILKEKEKKKMFTSELMMIQISSDSIINYLRYSFLWNLELHYNFIFRKHLKNVKVT